MSKRLLITGVSGLLGSTLALLAAEHGYDVHGTFCKQKVFLPHCKVHSLDITNAAASENLITTLKPDVIIHCAAFTNVDICETQREVAYKINVRGTHNLVAAAANRNIPFFHISTDAVFSGKRGMYTEQDTPDPMNYYGKTKAIAEEQVTSYKYGLVLRTNIFGPNISGKKSISTWFLEQLRKGNTITGFDDVFFNPLLTVNLAEALLELVESPQQGILHLAAPMGCSKYAFGKKIAHIFDLPRETITPTSMETIKLAAPRPKNATLNTTKAQQVLTTSLHTIDENIQRMKELSAAHYFEKKLCLTSERLYLRLLDEKDATQSYCDWLNDPEVNRYLVTQSGTLESCREFIRAKNTQHDCFFFGIFERATDKHIGNIKLEPIDYQRKRATYSILIGDKEYWGKGIGTEATQLILHFAFQNLDMEVVDLGVIKEHESALRIYKKLGFIQTGIDQNKHKLRDGYHDNIVMELSKKNFKRL
jgi:dTDP-4-dehydrorhamnose reductase